jgi:osmotically-inducible protein OsmY
MPLSRKDQRLTRRMSNQSGDASDFEVTRVGSEGGEVLLVGTVISEMQGAGAVASALAS